MKRKSLILILSLYFLPLVANQFENGIEPWGVDSELAMRPRTAQSTPQKSFGRKTCKGMITFFQNYISPIDGPRSSYYPTSSQYALDAIQKYGVLKGIALGCDRLLRENGDVWVYDLTLDYGPERKLDPVR